MQLFEQEVDIPVEDTAELVRYFGRAVQERLPSDQIPVRFVITRSDRRGYHCEVGVLAGTEDYRWPLPAPIFEFTPRKAENTDKFNAVLLVPTGIGAEIGGHSGDAGPVARLLASACDTLITHPNVVNGADINELPDNGLYVEGSTICRLLMGTAGLQKVRANRVLVVTDEHREPRITELIVNAVSAARATLGLDCPAVIKTDPSVQMLARYASSGRSTGRIEGFERLCEVISRHRDTLDAVALATVIRLPDGFYQDYVPSHGEVVNPWGGVEALLTHTISLIFDVPCAHAPMVESMELLQMHVGVVDPRISADAISSCFFHSVLKGLHRSPRIVRDRAAFGQASILTAADVSCLVIPDGCVGLPTLAAFAQGIPLIAVRENRNRMRNELERLPHAPGKLFVVDNYLEAAGVMTALKAGVALSSVRRPIAPTTVLRQQLPRDTAQEALAPGEVSSARQYSGTARPERPPS